MPEYAAEGAESGAEGAEDTIPRILHSSFLSRKYTEHTA
jgi:hypothetical protein